MKSRSHRLAVSEPRHDDWVDGSWTVDCVCGVNYDDGEEMVDCDECGVWVHTRCSRYVKSEKSFSCDKCKSKSSGSGLGNDSEEAEVAEFLVELPTKTMRMDNPSSASVAPRRPFRLWTDIPMEERVHVQGVPGGEPGLFSGSGMPSIFGPSLWKSAGYVPKKFNFRYNEFPSSDHGTSIEKEKESAKMSGEGNADEADSGAGVLFSLMKENGNSMPTPVADSVRVKSPVEGSGCHELLSRKKKKNAGVENPIFSCPEDSRKKESSSVPIMLHFGKRKKEGHEMLKDQSVKKRTRTVVEEGDVKRQGNAFKAASTSSSDAKPLESSQDRGNKAVNITCGQNVLRDQQTVSLGECATNLASNEHCLETTRKIDITSDKLSRGGNIEDHGPVRFENLSKTNNSRASLTELNGSLRQHVKQEVPKGTLHCRGGVEGGTENAETGSHDKEFVAVDVKITSPGSKERLHGQSSNIDLSNSPPNKKLKGELDADVHHHHHVVEPLPLTDMKLQTMKVTTSCPNLCVNVGSEEDKAIEASVISSEASNPKLFDATRSPIVGSSKTDTSDESPRNPYKRQPTFEGPTGAKKQSLGTKYSSAVPDEHKSHGTTKSHSTASYQRKTVSLVKSTSTLSGNISKPSDNHTTSTSQNPSHSRQTGLSESTVAIMKDSTSADKVDHEERFGRQKKLAKEHSRHLLKIPESTELLLTPDSKKVSSDSKVSSFHSSKVPLVSNVALNPVSGECSISPPKIESSSNMQIKAAAETRKVEKLSQSASAKGNSASVTAPTSANVPATLRDEELALLLHQELNSSPRVPRVPRMRHAGSLPQLTGPSATSVLIKRTSSSGGKEHIVASRRRTKDFSGEGTHGSVEVENEAKKMEGKPTSPINRRRDSGHSTDRLSSRAGDFGRTKSVHPIKKTNMCSSLSSSLDANGHNLPSSRSSSRAVCDNDHRMVGRLTNRTLPSLIAEIMKEGKRITYEELCNSVLPHWPHLRKHNGERYAYSSHNQAVLDCLRNRSEWARLVDRGPKTTSTRKRRKFDADSMSMDSEDDEENMVKNPKDSGSKSFESHHDDVPKGKRKARKRRRLALQGGGIVRRRRRRVDVVSDDESESFSNSTEEDNSTSSEEEKEETQGGGASSVGGSEASASSDEVS